MYLACTAVGTIRSIWTIFGHRKYLLLLHFWHVACIKWPQISLIVQVIFGFHIQSKGQFLTIWFPISSQNLISHVDSGQEPSLHVLVRSRRQSMSHELQELHWLRPIKCYPSPYLKKVLHPLKLQVDSLFRDDEQGPSIQALEDVISPFPQDFEHEDQLVHDP